MKEEFTFDNQRPNENVILVSYQHPWVLAKIGFLLIILTAIIVIIFIIFGESMVSAIFLIVAIIVGGFYSFNTYYLFKNVIFILTDQRIIYINQSSIFGRKVQETELENIYNLSFSIKGFIKNMLNFGKIELTTEGDVNDRIVMNNLPEPQEKFTKLSKARKEVMDKVNKPIKEQPIIR